MNRWLVPLLLSWPQWALGQLFEERPPYVGPIASVTITYFGRIGATIIDGQGNRQQLSTGYGKLGKTTKLAFDDHARMTHRTLLLWKQVVTDEVFHYDTIEGTIITRIDHLKHPFLSGSSTVALVQNGSHDPVEWTGRNGECTMPNVPKEERQYDATYVDGRLNSFRRLWVAYNGDTLRHTHLSMNYDSIGRLVLVEEKTCGQYTYFNEGDSGAPGERITIKHEDPILVTTWAYAYGDSDRPETMEIRYLGKEYLHSQRSKAMTLEFKYDDQGNWTSIFERGDNGRPLIKERQKIKYRRISVASSRP